MSPSPKASASSSGPPPVLDRRTTPASLTLSNPNYPPIRRPLTWRHDHDLQDEIHLGTFPLRGHRVGPGPDQLGLCPTTREGVPQDREGWRPGHLLPRGRAEGRPDDSAAPRLSDQFADVPQPCRGGTDDEVNVCRRQPGT